MGVDAQMYVRTDVPFTDQQLRDWCWEIAEAFGPDRFFISDEKGYERRALARTETGLEVSLWGRYYGPGYERGDLPFLVAVADWLERRIPGAEIWYGGDTGGSEVFGREVREQYLAHFAEVGHRPYAGDPRSGDNDRLGIFGKTDGWARRICPFCDESMMRNGWGGSFAVLQCYGCGLTEDTHDSGETWVKRTEVGGRPVREKVSA